MDELRDRRERELYEQLLDLSPTDPFGPTLERVLRLVREVTDAQQAFLTVRSRAGEELFWSASAVDSETLEEIRERISQGVLEEALTSGAPVNSPLAFRDPRFSSRSSVRGQRIRAVLCVPLALPDGTAVLMLQGRTVARPFDDRDIAMSRRTLNALHGQLTEAASLGSGPEDPTLLWRSGLVADGMAGRSLAMAQVFRAVAMFAPVEGLDLLVEGATGSGKSMLAKVIHDSSPRRDGPLVFVPCGTLGEGIIESHLFGQVDGAYTGSAKRAGYVASAEGGTLVLDDIDALPVSRQAVLLRFMQTRLYRPVGADRELRANVRVIATTNANVEQLVSQGLLRLDLLQRLAGMRIPMPDLEDRREDIPLIAKELIERRAAQTNLQALPLSPGAANQIQQRHWPGGVRELDGLLVSALVQANHSGARCIETEHLQDVMTSPLTRSAPQTYHEAWAQWARALLQERLAAADGNRSEAARSLGLSRSRFYELLKQLGIQQ